jgi:hypothetical protein
MLMPPTLSETGLLFQPKISDRRSGAAAQRSPVRSGVTLDRIRPPKKTGQQSTIFILKALLFSSNSYSFFACVSHENPRISQKTRRANLPHTASSLAPFLHFLIGVLYFPLDAFQFALFTLAGKVNYSLLAVLVRSFFGGVNAFDNHRVTAPQSVAVRRPHYSDGHIRHSQFPKRSLIPELLT